MERAFLSVLNMSIAASWLVLALFALRFLLKNAPKAAALVLWAMAGLRLVLPFSIKSMLSLIPSAETVPQEILYSQMPNIRSGIAALNAYVNPALETSLAPQIGASVNPAQIVIGTAAAIWLSGMAAMLLHGAAGYLRLRGRVASGVRLSGNIYQSEAVAAPFVLGLFHPRIYIPFRMDEDNLSHVLAHEQAHIRHFDHWWKPIGFAVLTLHWFNPLVWLAFILFCRDVELACDERVIKELSGEAKKAYLAALIGLNESKSYPAVCPLAFSETGIKGRVKRILRYKKPSFWIILASLLCCAALAVFFLTSPKVKAGTLPRKSAASGLPIGVYAFEENIYTSPLSSFLALEGTGLLYCVGETFFATMDEVSHEIKSETTFFEWNVEEIAADVWESDGSLFSPSIDLAKYSTRLMYTAEGMDKTLCLCLMDGEVWLVRLGDSNGLVPVWSIYKLKLLDMPVEEFTPES